MRNYSLVIAIILFWIFLELIYATTEMARIADTLDRVAEDVGKAKP